MIVSRAGTRQSRLIACAVLLATLAGCASLASQNPAKAVVEAKFAAVNRHSIDDIEKLYAPFASITAPNFCAPRHGREDVRRIYQDLFTSFPEIHAEMQEYLVPISNWFTVRDGLITTDDGVFDNGGRKCAP